MKILLPKSKKIINLPPKKSATKIPYNHVLELKQNINRINAEIDNALLVHQTNFDVFQIKDLRKAVDKLVQALKGRVIWTQDSHYDELTTKSHDFPSSHKKY